MKKSKPTLIYIDSNVLKKGIEMHYNDFQRVKNHQKFNPDATHQIKAIVAKNHIGNFSMHLCR